TFVLTLTPTAPIAPTDVAFRFACANVAQAATISGVNTLLFAASTTPSPDIVALAATPSRDGVVNIGGIGETGFFSVATMNMGAPGEVTVSADTGGVALPVSILICETDATAKCKGTPSSSVMLRIDANDKPTFSVFVTASGTVPFDPVNNRIFVRFRDSGGLTRGLTSVAVSAGPFLTEADVRLLGASAAKAIDSPTQVIAVTDRVGNVLAVFRKPNAPATAIGNFGLLVDTNELAIALARTGAFFSNDQAPLSSRTVRFISGIHFPPGVT